MAQSGYTPILIYGSTTPGNLPLATDLSNNSGGCELAINVADGKLYYKDSGGVVQVIADKTGTGVKTFSAGTTGLTPNIATSGVVTLAGTLITTNGGTGLSSFAAGDLMYYAAGTAMSKLTIGSANQILTSSGTAPQWTTLSGVAVTTLSFGTTGLTPNSATSGAITVAGTLVAANGGTGISSYTTGDLLYASGSTTLSKLGIGTNGQVLGVAGGVLAYITPSGTTSSTLTITTSGGAAAPATFNGSAPITIDYSTVGADPAGTAVAMAIALG